MSMELIKCPLCGDASSIQIMDTLYVCGYCGSKFHEKEFQNLSQQLDNARMCKGTEHAIKNGLWVNDNNGNSCWWLRSPYCFGSDYARYVLADGVVDYYIGVDYDIIGVRPACIINI